MGGGMELIESIRESGGWLNRYRHDSSACACPMTFSVYLPPAAEVGPVPAVYWLSGLTCTDDNARTKAGAQRYAAELGIALVFPDTSPRGAEVPDVPERYDLGQGAGFYVNATQAPWAGHYRMYDYVVEELPALIERELPLMTDRRSVCGHSMGGHGALTLAMNLPGRFTSVSAFAPIAHPTSSDWGRKQLAAYLGSDETTWAKHDATLLMAERGFDGPILIDQGTDDQFLDLLKPEALAEAMAKARQNATLRMQPGYDHSYFFISTFMEDHIAFHADALYAR